MNVCKSATLTLLCSIAAVGFGDTARGGETGKLDGTWVVESVLRDPREEQPGEGKGLRIKVSGDRVLAKLPGKEKPVGTVTIERDTTLEPKRMDFLMNGGSVTVRAIYEIEADTLRVCLSPPGKARPTEFASKQGSGHTLVVLRRSKPR